MVLKRAMLSALLGLSLSSVGCSSTDAVSEAPLHACAPLESTISTVTLDAQRVLAAGRSADGTAYVVTQENSKLRLFVSDANAEAETLVERPVSGSGEVQDGGSQIWLLDGADASGSPLSVQVVQDASGMSMGVLKGPKPDGAKTWPLEQGELLTALPAVEAAALPALSGQAFFVDYEGSHSDGRAIVLIAPERAGSYDDYRLFWGMPAELRERVITSFSRARSIGGPTTVVFETEAGRATLSYSFHYPIPETGGMSEGSLELGGKTDPLSGIAPAALPDGAQFLCR